MGEAGRARSRIHSNFLSLFFEERGNEEGREKVDEARIFIFIVFSATVHSIPPLRLARIVGERERRGHFIPNTWALVNYRIVHNARSLE